MPSEPTWVVTIALPSAIASSTLRRVPLPARSGTTYTAAACTARRTSATKPATRTRGASASGTRKPSGLPTSSNSGRAQREDAREHLGEKPFDAVAVRKPAHLADEHQLLRRAAVPARAG